jgi:O-antigen/teichoic acid export membrane protein
VAGALGVPVVRPAESLREAAMTPLRDALKKLSSESLIYGLGQVSGRAVQLLLVPVLTLVLARGEYGVSELVLAYLQTAVLVLVFGMDGALARFFYHEPDRAARIRMASSSLAFRLVTGGLAALLLALFATPLSRALVGSEVYRKYVLLGAATLPFTLVVLFGNDVLRVTFQPWKFITLNLVQTVLTAALSLWLVLGKHMGVAGVLYGRLGGDVASALFALVLVRHTIAPRISPAVLRKMLGYGAPLVPVALAYGAITSVDRFVLQRTRGLEDVAVYGVAIKFFDLVTMGVSAFQLAYGPFAFARAGSPDSGRLYARVLSAYVAVASFAAMLGGLFAPEVLAIAVPPSYAGAAGPAAFLAFAAVAQGAYSVVSVGIGLALRTPLLGWSAGGAAIVAGVANLLLAPRMGPLGAGIATTLGYVTSVVLAYVIAQRVHPAPFRGLRLTLAYALALALTLAGQRMAPPGAAGVAVKVATALAFAVAVWRLGLLAERGAVARASRAGPAPAGT